MALTSRRRYLAAVAGWWSHLAAFHTSDRHDRGGLGGHVGVALNLIGPVILAADRVAITTPHGLITARRPGWTPILAVGVSWLVVTVMLVWATVAPLPVLPPATVAAWNILVGGIVVIAVVLVAYAISQRHRRPWPPPHAWRRMCWPPTAPWIGGDLYVAPDHRGHGHATSLTGALVAALPDTLGIYLLADTDDLVTTYQRLTDRAGRNSEVTGRWLYILPAGSIEPERS